MLLGPELNMIFNVFPVAKLSELMFNVDYRNDILLSSLFLQVRDERGNPGFLAD